jgi:hypothetical protein
MEFGRYTGGTANVDHIDLVVRDERLHAFLTECETQRRGD